MRNFYSSPRWRLYLLLPVALMLLCAGVVAVKGVQLGIELSGGITIVAITGSNANLQGLDSQLQSQFGVQHVSIRETIDPLGGERGVMIEFKNNQKLLDAENIVATDPVAAKSLVASYVGANDTAGSAVEYVNLAKNNFKAQLRQFLASRLDAKEDGLSFEEVGPALGAMFWESSKWAILFAFIIVAVLVYLNSRQLMPAIGVCTAPVFDAICAVAGMTLLGIPLGMPSMAAMLMLMGYCVDDNIMMTNRLLRKKNQTAEEINEKLFGAMITGLTMTGTTLVVLAVIFVASYFMQLGVMSEISTVLFMGLTGDLVGTWILNGMMLKWWLLRKQ